MAAVLEDVKKNAIFLLQPHSTDKHGYLSVHTSIQPPACRYSICSSKTVLISIPMGTAIIE